MNRFPGRVAARAGTLVIGFLLTGPVPARATDQASLQFTVPAPDPVQAGETLQIQALAVNTGADTWDAGSYYWVAEIYDLEENLVGRTDQISPPRAVTSGDVAAISLPFRVPDTLIGRRLYRVFLVKDARQLIRSEFKPFQIVEKPIPEPPKAVDYRVEGNVTVSYRNTSRNSWAGHNGATTINAVGKIKESSYLFNAYLLHQPGQVVDPFIVLLTYYAPWGTIYGGDINPSLTELGINGQGMRGAMLEQRKGPWDWALLGGQTVDSQAGTATTNGRFARTLLGAKLGRKVFNNLDVSANYFLSTDETGSLSTDPNSSNFRGPSLLAQKNSGAGVGMTWRPKSQMKMTFAFQRNNFFQDTTKGSVSDSAWKGEFRWDKTKFKVKTFVQRAGANYVAFGSPAIVGDRLTFDGALSIYPAAWYSGTFTGNQFRDNLDNDPTRTTTTQRFISTSHNFRLPTGTSLNLNGSVNTAVGDPKAALNNQTTTVGLGASHSFGRQSISLSLQTSLFRDKANLAADLDTNTISLSSNFLLPKAISSSLGVTRSDTKDKTNGTKRTSTTISPSFARRMGNKLTGQWWATYTQNKNTSATFPQDSTVLSLNSEYTWTRTARMTVTVGLGYNINDDKVTVANDFNEITVSTRLSYSF